MVKLYIIFLIVGVQLFCSTSISVLGEEGEDDSISEDEDLYNEEEGNENEADTGNDEIVTVKPLHPSMQPPNEFVDHMLDILRIILTMFSNGIPLPKSIHSVEERIWGIPFRAHANFYDGNFKGLQSVARTGEAKIYKNLGPLWVFDIKLRDMEFNYGFSFEVMGVGPTGHMKGTLESIIIGLQLKKTPDGGLSLQDFDVKEIGDFRVDTSGLGVFNYIVNAVVFAIGYVGKGILLESLEEKFRELMNDWLDFL